MKKVIQWGLFLFLSGVITSASAQIQWTPEQKSVWKTETTIFDLMMKGDLQSALTYYDDSYQGWNSDASIPIPISKSEMETSANFHLAEGGKFIFHNVVPVVIWVNGNYAYADYYFEAMWENKDGKRTNEHGRWTDILLKKDGKWMLVGDHGGSVHEPQK